MFRLIMGVSPSLEGWSSMWATGGPGPAPVGNDWNFALSTAGGPHRVLAESPWCIDWKR